MVRKSSFMGGLSPLVTRASGVVGPHVLARSITREALVSSISLITMLVYRVCCVLRCALSGRRGPVTNRDERVKN
jgi:hypothetical protein